MQNRWIENGLTTALDEEGIGCIVFSPLAQGQLTSRYLKEIPADSRAARNGFLKSDQVRANLPRIQELNAIAGRRGQSLAQMAIAWVLRLPASLPPCSAPARSPNSKKISKLLTG